MLVEEDPASPFIVISPQLPEESGVSAISPIPPLEAILDHAPKTLRVDPSRVYLPGLSLGGMATLGIGQRLIPNISRRWRRSRLPETQRACNARDVPVWAFHGDHDDVVDTRGDFEMVDALKKCGAAPRLTIYRTPTTGRGCPPTTIRRFGCGCWNRGSPRRSVPSHPARFS